MIAATLSLGSAVALGWLYRRQHRATRSRRARLLDGCTDLLHDLRRSTNPAGFDRLCGHRDGYAVSLELEEDHATLRKLPSLWLHVSVAGGVLPGGASLDILARPGNPLAGSPSFEWDHGVRPLPGWPEDALYRTAGAAPDLRAIDDDVRHLFADEKVKELVVTPRRVRLTWQAKQAKRGDYQLLRAAVFDEESLAREDVERLLAQLVSVRRHLEAASGVAP